MKEIEAGDAKVVGVVGADAGVDDGCWRLRDTGAVLRSHCCEEEIGCGRAQKSSGAGGVLLIAIAGNEDAGVAGIAAGGIAVHVPSALVVAAAV